MQIHDREPLEGDRERIVLVPDTPDDLWHLYHIVEPGDHVAGDTHRRIQRKDEHMRSTGGQREHMRVTLAVEDVDFDRFSERLRIGGEIVDASREDQLGLAHTLNIEIHDELTLEKRLKPDQADRLEAAVETGEQPDVVIVAIEEGEAVVHTVAEHGTEEHATVRSSTGKNEYADDRSALFANLAEVLTHMDADRYVLAGPGFTKRDAADYLETERPEIAGKCTVVDTSSGGARGVQEVLKRGVLEDVQTAARIAEETRLIEELMERIATEQPVTYGIEQVAKAADFGAIDHLLIVDERLRTERGAGGEWSLDIEAVLTDVEQSGGEITVFSNDFEPGQRLAQLGGVAALLRYRID